MPFSPIGEDTPRDPEHPAALEAVEFRSSGDRCNGVAYLPSGAGPHPTVLMLHGFPGYERNFDLAHVLRRAGWVVVIFHYRGSWGSEGAFSFTHVLEDTASALDHVRSDTMVASCRIDPNKVALIGASMGGWAALMTAAKRDVWGAASIAGFNFGAVGAQAAKDRKGLEDLAGDLQGAMGPLASTDPRTLAEEVVTNCDSFDLYGLSGALVDCPLLLIAASVDEVAPMDVHHVPLTRALRDADAQQLSERVFETDHSFSDHRVKLARTILDWLPQLTRARTPR